MLVISRRLGQMVRIGDDIEVMVVRLSEDKVRLGISAPRGVVILREELLHPPIPAEAACDGDWDEDEPETGGES